MSGTDLKNDAVGKYGRDQLELLKKLARLDYELAERSFYHFFKAAWSVLEPTTPRLDNWHQEAIAEYLEAVYAGDITRLIINMPPRYSKSLLVTVMFPAWCWVRDPSMKFINASYAEDLAVKHAVDRRILMQSPWYQRAWSNRFEFSSEQNQKSEYLNDKRGHCVATGMLGAVTGKGGDCLTGASLIDTEIGQIPIAHLVEMPYKPRVASYNHDRNCLEFREIEACKVTYASDLIEIQTEAGKGLTCTADHLIYCEGKGYRKAADLVRGDRILSESERPSLLPLQQTTQGKLWLRLHGVLSSVAGIDVDLKMRALRKRVCATALRGKQKGKTRTHRRLLRTAMLARRSCSKEPKAMRELLFNRAGENSKVLCRLQTVNESARPIFAGSYLRSLREIISTNIEPVAILHAAMRECSAFYSDAGRGEFTLQGRKKLLDLIRQNEPTSDISSRPRPMRRLRKQFRRRATCSASHRRKSAQQHAGEFNSIVSALPYASPQVEMRSDAISLVRRIRRDREPVYDIQVENNRNFLAQGILVHNCVIIDDPHNPKKAESEAERKSAVEAFDSTFTTRLDNKKTGRIIVVMQRLHHRDLTGHLLSKKEEGEHWDHLKLPAEAPRRTVISLPMSKRKILRNEGDILHPAREGRKQLEAMKVSLGSYNFEGQYQQNPVPRAGGIFKKTYWRYYTQVPAKFDEIIQSWDMTFKDATKSDFVAGMVLGRVGADIYILDCVHARLSFGGSRDAVKELTRRYPLAFKKLIENKANGPAIQNDLKSKIMGIVLEEPQGSKMERAAYCEPFLEAGNVHLPHPHIAQPWVKAFIDESAAFPRGEHDDMVDAFTQGVKHLVKNSLDKLKALGQL